jgi:DNA invertase Pin-like site-specific DNA recombinase
MSERKCVDCHRGSGSKVGRKRKELGEEIELYKLGVPIAKIARRKGITRQSLWRAFKLRGIV